MKRLQKRKWGFGVWRGLEEGRILRGVGSLSDGACDVVMQRGQSREASEETGDIVRLDLERRRSQRGDGEESQAAHQL